MLRRLQAVSAASRLCVLSSRAGTHTTCAARKTRVGQNAAKDVFEAANNGNAQALATLLERNASVDYVNWVCGAPKAAALPPARALRARHSSRIHTPSAPAPAGRERPAPRGRPQRPPRLPGGAVARHGGRQPPERGRVRGAAPGGQERARGVPERAAGRGRGQGRRHQGARRERDAAWSGAAQPSAMRCVPTF